MYLKSILTLFFVALVFALIPQTAFANPNNFYFESFDADYYLSIDDNNRSSLVIKEKLVAIFPNYDQNHGIERAIPTIYDNHPVNPNIIRVTNEKGIDIEYTTYKSNDNLVVKIGSDKKFVYGKNTYNIEYGLSDVTKSYPAGDEFYWDTNGTQWKQAFNSNTSRLHIDSKLIQNFTGQVDCYSGPVGSNLKNCTANIDSSNDNKIITISSTLALEAGENITMVVSFKSETFASYISPPLSFNQKIFYGIIIVILALWYLIIPICLFIWSFSRWKKFGRDAKTNTAIVPQYLAPKNISIIEADIIKNSTMSNKAITATIIDLAVRHYWRIFDLDNNDYEIEIIKDTSDLLESEKAIVKIIFTDNFLVGSKIKLNNEKNLYSQTQIIANDCYIQSIVDGYMIDTRKIQKKVNLFGVLLIILSILTLNIIGFFSAIAMMMFARNMPALSNKGIELKTYLGGLNMYMKVAEQDRIKLLQGANTAEIDSKQLIILYEKLLPYAILYGIDKSWTEQLSHLYIDQAPTWFNGNNQRFNSIMFAGAINSFNSTTSNSFAPPTNSGDSGFSGGSSGGGGGGGGGGGW